MDSELRSAPDFMSMKAMIGSWLENALLYELWLGSDGFSAHKIYYADLPWPLGKILYLKQIHAVKQQLGITKENAERKEAEVMFLSIFIGHLVCLIIATLSLPFSLPVKLLMHSLISFIIVFINRSTVKL